VAYNGGFFKIREEVLLVLSQRFSLQREDVLSELCVLVKEKLNIPRTCLAFNARNWNVRRYRALFRDYPVYVTVSTHRDEFVNVRVSIPKHSGDKCFDLDKIVSKADRYVTEKLESILEPVPW
jgi:hypothetical protein